MVTTSARLGVFLLLTILLASCAGQSTSVDPAASRDTAAGALDEASTYFDLKGGERISYADAYQRLESKPGTAGTDYDASRIMVAYDPQAPALKGGSQLPGAGSSSAASQGNAINKQNTQFIAWTDKIAQDHGLEIRSQVYVADNNFACFQTRDGSDAAGIIMAIRSDASLAPAVEHAFYEPLHQACFTPNDPDYLSSNSNGGSGGQWSLHKIGASTGWDFTRGASDVWLAVVDTGVRTTHEELNRACFTSADFPGEKLNVINDNTNISDGDGHGTFIAGIVAAEGNNGRTITGVAPDIRVLPVKIANGGSAPLGSIIDGCYLGFNLGADVINLSWGSYGGPVPQEQAMVNFIWNNGGIFVSAAGNDNTSDAHYPCSYTNAISTGSTSVGTNDARAGFSNFGTYVDMAAPGNSLKSCRETGDSAYVPNSQGTSFSAPIVASVAALMWSFKSDLTNAEIRAMMYDTGQPTSGFSGSSPVRRVDLPGIFEVLAAEAIELPLLDSLTVSGTKQFSINVAGSPDSVVLYVNEEVAQVLTSAPWDFTVDFSNYLFESVNLRFSTVIDGQPVSRSLDVIVDNSPATFPLQEDFEDPERDFYPADFRFYSDALMDAVKQQAGWSSGTVRANGSALWKDQAGQTNSGAFAQHIVNDFNSYSPFETDALISRRISFKGISDPSLVFHHHFNIENGGSEKDRAWVLVTDDEGASYSPGKLKGVTKDSYWSGYLPGWSTAAVDMSAFAGKTVRVLFFFESDASGAGEDSGEATGWWLDDITVGRAYQEDFPSIDGVDFIPGSSVGLAPNLQQFAVSVENPVDVSKVRYWLDVAPFGELVPGLDTIVDVESGGVFDGLINVPGLPNQAAQLNVYVYDAGGNQGPVTTIPCWIFNLPGDADADNDVDMVDYDLIHSKHGLLKTSPGYLPFYDSNLDGIVNEVDLSAVGYFLGESI
ncbi:S8 family serine peptidase [bacterium]|nr:S8 family serine peptidase [bacterium]